MEKDIIVIKYGGSAMTEGKNRKNFLANIAKLLAEGKKIVVVHGGGPEINRILQKLGKESKFIQGNRVSDEEIVEVAEMVLSGRLNKGIVGEFNTLGIKAIGLSGKDGKILEVRKKYLEIDGKKIDIGFVGEVIKVDVELIRLLLDNGYLPIISTIASDREGNTFNINADYVAGEIAGKLKAKKLLFFTDVDGVYRDFEDKSSLITRVSEREIRNLIEGGTISGGMLPKVETCLNALAKGIDEVVILNGKIIDIVGKYFSDEKIGTTIVK